MSDALLELHCAGALAAWLPRGCAPHVAVGDHGGVILAAVRGRAVVSQTVELDPGDRRACALAWLGLCAWAHAEVRAASAPVQRFDGGAT